MFLFKLLGSAILTSAILGAAPQSSALATPSSPEFVTSIYQDVFGRIPDPNGLAYWAGQLSAGALSRAQLATVFLTSPESLDSGAYVAKLYVALLGQEPDYPGWSAWTAEADAKGTNAVAERFFKQPQFGHLDIFDDAAFVTWAYDRILGHLPDTSGEVYFVNLLKSGNITRAGVIDELVRSPEYDVKALPHALANLLYLALLRRTPDPAGLAYWTTMLQDPTILTGVVGSFLSSQEYQQRF